METQQGKELFKPFLLNHILSRKYKDEDEHDALLSQPCYQIIN